MSANLLAHIREERPVSGATLWWLGQSGFVIKSAGSTIVVDAFLTDYGAVGRRYASPITPHDLTDADLLVGTHDHLDHIDPEGLPTMALASPQAVVVVPHPVVERVVELGIPRQRVRGAEVDVPLDSDGVRILPIPALHGASPEHGYGFHCDEDGRYPFLGYAFEVDGVRIGHVGDTLVYEGLGERLRSLELNLLILPINGRSWYRERRGIVGKPSRRLGGIRHPALRLLVGEGAPKAPRASREVDRGGCDASRWDPGRRQRTRRVRHDAITNNTHGYEEALNVPNRGYIENLPSGAVVEVPCMVDANGVSGIHVGRLPEPIAALCRTQLTIADLNVRAFLAGDRDLVYQLLAIDPMVRDLDAAVRLADEYIELYRDYFQFV